MLSLLEASVAANLENLAISDEDPTDIDQGPAATLPKKKKRLEI